MMWYSTVISGLARVIHNHMPGVSRMVVYNNLITLHRVGKTVCETPRRVKTSKGFVSGFLFAARYGGGIGRRFKVWRE